MVVSGTNGKTTTTKIIVELLKSHGLSVFTNPSGSNFTRGVVASLLDHVDKEGRLQADIAVLELDEAHAVHFANAVTPSYSLILNVYRDQLDRFGEIDRTAQLLEKVVAETTRGVVLNNDDELVARLSSATQKNVDVQYFGVSETLRKLFPSDIELHSKKAVPSKKSDSKNVSVILEKLTKAKATFRLNGRQKTTSLKLRGIYNVQNAAAALALARMILGDSFDVSSSLATLSSVRPAFGRGEAIEVEGRPLEIVLVKNPSGFRLSLTSYKDSPASTMIAINDLYADGRDMSWLWDVDFSQFKKSGVTCVSGIRAYDMALRLHYDEISVQQIIPNVPEALRNFISHDTAPKRIFCTYTAMLSLRRELSKTHPLEAIE